MRKALYIMLGTICAFTAWAEAFAAEAHSLERHNRTRGREAGLFLDIQKFNLGTLNNVEDKKQYLSTIQLEKQRIQNFTLRMAYYDAYIFYKRRDYQRAQDLAQAILTVDPDFQQARTLAEQSYRMGTYGTISEGEIIDVKMEEGKRLYNAGRMVESADKFKEVLTIQPRNAAAKSWYDKTQVQIANELEARGDQAYREKRYDLAIDRWYSSLLIRKSDSSLVKKISNLEGEMRRKQLEAAMKDGVDKYSQGKLVASYDAFQRALKIQPSEAKAEKFSMQIKGELASGYVSSGNKYYNQGKYDTAVKNYQEAKKWGYDAAKADKLIAAARRAKEDAVNKPKPPVRTGTGGAGGTGGTGPGGSTEEPPAPPIFYEPITPPVNPAEDPSKRVVSEEQRRLSMERYMAGLRAYNEEQYEEAKREWGLAKQLDPGNSDADAGIKKVDEIMGL